MLRTPVCYEGHVNVEYTSELSRKCARGVLSTPVSYQVNLNVGKCVTRFLFQLRCSASVSNFDGESVNLRVEAFSVGVLERKGRRLESFMKLGLGKGPVSVCVVLLEDVVYCLSALLEFPVSAQGRCAQFKLHNEDVHQSKYRKILQAMASGGIKRARHALHVSMNRGNAEKWQNIRSEHTKAATL